MTFDLKQMLHVLKNTHKLDLSRKNISLIYVATFDSFKITNRVNQAVVGFKVIDSSVTDSETS